jgi:NADPH2:quinone reductase
MGERLHMKYSNMKAMVCDSFGPIGQLRYTEHPIPAIQDSHVLIEVGAASVNFPDALMVQGLYQVKPPFPFVPGHELAGVVREIGAGVSRYQVGQRVVATPGVGAFAQFTLAHEDKVLPMPDSMSLVQGASLTLVYGTTIHALKNIAQLQESETMLVLGASGGVGLAAIQLGKLMGAKVIAAASSPEKLAACQHHGADATINYLTDDLRALTKQFTQGKGVDVVYDAVGGHHTELALRSLAWRGRLLVVGFASGIIPQIPLNLALLSERRILGVYWGEWIKREPESHLRNMKFIMEHIEKGSLRTMINHHFPLDQSVQAIELLASRQAIGKVVIDINPGLTP